MQNKQHRIDSSLFQLDSNSKYAIYNTLNFWVQIRHKTRNVIVNYHIVKGICQHNGGLNTGEGLAT